MSYLGPADEERLQVFAAAELARAVRARGHRLNAPEAVAIITDEMHLAARGGASFEEVRAVGERALTPSDVLDGVGDIVTEVRVEVLLDEGSRLVVLHAPLGGGPSVEPAPGAIRTLENRPRATLLVTNTSARTIVVSSHYPFWLVNDQLEFDRAAAEGLHLDVPAGDVMRWEAGETRRVTLVGAGAARCDG